MRTPAFCICENKDADQLHGNSAPVAVQSGLFRGLVGNPEDRFFSQRGSYVLKEDGPNNVVSANQASSVTL